MKRKSRLMRVDENFYDELKDLKIDRIKKDIDKELKSDRRLTEAIIRHHSWKEIKKDILLSPLPKRKKGGVENIILWFVIPFIIVILFAVWIYGHGLLTDTLTTIGMAGGVNITEAAEDTFGQADTAMESGLKTLALVMIICLAIEVLLFAMFTQEHIAISLILHFIITMFAVIFSVYISNAYESIMTGSSVIAPTLLGFKGASTIIIHLPRWVTVIGLLGLILIIASYIIRRRAGTQLI